jgi:hypothetical protein
MSKLSEYDLWDLIKNFDNITIEQVMKMKEVLDNPKSEIPYAISNALGRDYPNNITMLKNGDIYLMMLRADYGAVYYIELGTINKKICSVLATEKCRP